MTNKISIKKIAIAGLLAALVFVASMFLQFPIATPIDNTRIHLGNVMCILSGLLLGGFLGGSAAGIGSVFFDLLNPLYIASAPFTLVFKFFIGFIAGSISHAKGRNGLRPVSNIVGGILGSLAYILLYLGKSFIEYRYVLMMETTPALAALVPKAAASLINAVIAVVIAVPLAAAINAAMKKANVSLG